MARAIGIGNTDLLSCKSPTLALLNDPGSKNTLPTSSVSSKGEDDNPQDDSDPTEVARNGLLEENATGALASR